MEGSDSEYEPRLNLMTTEKEIKLSFASTNTRSLPPKMNAILEIFDELQVMFFAITETWLKGNREEAQSIKDVADSHGVSFITKNRVTRGGGVALLYDSNIAKFKEIKIKNNCHEVLFVEGQIAGLSRRICVAVIYIPPKLKVAEVDVLSSFIADALEDIKRRMDDPLFILTGDFNGKDFCNAIADFPEIRVLPTPLPEVRLASTWCSRI